MTTMRLNPGLVTGQRGNSGLSSARSQWSRIFFLKAYFPGMPGLFTRDNALLQFQLAGELGKDARMLPRLDKTRSSEIRAICLCP